MFVPDKLKLNKFQLVRIPSNKDYFGRVGLTGTGPSSSYTGDEIAPMAQSKMDQIAETDAEYGKFLHSQGSED